MASHRSAIHELRGVYRMRHAHLLYRIDTNHMTREANFPSLDHILTEMDCSSADDPFTFMKQDQQARFLSPDKSRVAED